TDSKGWLRIPAMLQLESGPDLLDLGHVRQGRRVLRVDGQSHLRDLDGLLERLPWIFADIQRMPRPHRSALAPTLDGVERPRVQGVGGPGRLLHELKACARIDAPGEIVPGPLPVEHGEVGVGGDVGRLYGDGAPQGLLAPAPQLLRVAAMAPL